MYTENNNTATFTLTNSEDCDSIVTLNLTIVDLQLSILVNTSPSGGTLTAEDENASYQWVDCDDGHRPVEGATGRSFSPSKVGSYAVVLSAIDCPEVKDTSACHTVNVTGIDMAAKGDGLGVFPNPTTGQVAVHSDQTIQNLQIIDLHGKLLLESNPKESTVSVDLRPLASGVYLLKVQTEQSIQRMKIIRQ